MGENENFGTTSSESVINFRRRVRTTRDFYRSPSSYMFIEDLRMGIMPIGGRAEKENKDFSIELEPYCEDVENLIIGSLSSRFGTTRDNLNACVSDFINEAAHTLAFFGKAYFEIVFYFSDNLKSEIKKFRIKNILNESINEFFGLYWQFLPKSLIKESQIKKKRFNVIPKEKLLVLKMPRKLGGVRRYRQLLKRIYLIGQESILPIFALEDMKDNRISKGFDSVGYREVQNFILAKVTRKIGWDGRGKFREMFLDFYQVYRYLEFQRTKAILRKYILNELNRTLVKVGKVMGFEAKIKINGLSTESYIRDLISKLEKGELEFSEALRIRVL